MLLALHVLLGVPAALTPWALGSLVLVPLGVLGGQLSSTAAAGEWVLVEAIVVAGLAVFVGAVYLIVVVGLVRPPVGAERDILLASVAAALVIALAVKLGLARQLLDSVPSTAAAQLEELRADVQTTIAAVRELAHGIYPPLLRQQGLGEALRTAATRSPLPCAVEVELPGRYPVEIETAVYFCCLEAIQNADKYAGGDASIIVRVDSDGPRLRFAVTDDGAGFATGPGGVNNGHGFVNMHDRLGAIGGTLDVESTPGRGVTVGGSVPATPIGASGRQ